MNLTKIKKYNKLLGKSAERAVYDLEEGKAIKIALNSGGRNQNEVEVKCYDKFPSPFFPDIHEYDDEFKYIIVKKVNPYKNLNDFIDKALPNFKQFLNERVDFIFNNFPYLFDNNKDFISPNIEKNLKYYLKKLVYLYFTENRNYPNIYLNTTHHEVKMGGKIEWYKLFIVEDTSYLDEDSVFINEGEDYILLFTYKELNDHFNQYKFMTELKSLFKEGCTALLDFRWNNLGSLKNEIYYLDLGRYFNVTIEPNPILNK